MAEEVLQLNTPPQALDDNGEVITGSERRVVAFVIDGTEYTCLATPKPHLALQYLNYVMTRGPDWAEAWLMRTALGEEGWNALLAFESLTRDQLAAVVLGVRRRVLGDPEGKARLPGASTNGSKKSAGRRRT